MRPPRGSCSGFSLTELLISVAISSLVMVALMSLFAAMVRQHIRGNITGEVSGLALVNLNQMNKEIEEATYIEKNRAAFPSSFISGCRNYSRTFGGTLDSSQVITAFYYCLDGSKRLWRHSETGSCPIGAVTCGTSGGTINLISRFIDYENPGTSYPPIFSISTAPPNSIALNYTVGMATATTNAGQVTMPVSILVRTVVRLNRSYNASVEDP